MAKSVKHVLLTVGSKSGNQWQDELVVAADAILLSTLVNRITSPSSNSQLSAAPTDAPQDKLPPTITTQLVHSWNRDPADDPWTVADAKRVMDDFTEQLDGRALICLGTVKSNPVAELAITHLFPGCDAFQDQQVAKPDQRGCPFAVVYRATDLHTASCWACASLYGNNSGIQPGVAYEDANGHWHLLPYSDNEDAAIVLYHYDKVRRSLLMMLGGFSARGTRCLAEMLKSKHADQLWPPTVQAESFVCGAFVVRFTAVPSDNGSSGRFHERLQSTTVIPIPSQTITRRLRAPEPAQY